MPITEDYLKFILDQLSEFGEVETKKMFGGVNLFKNDLMFAKIKNDRIWLKVDDTNVEDFKQKNMAQYSYGKDNSRKLNFYEAPIEVIENKKAFADWLRTSYQIAEKHKK